MCANVAHASEKASMFEKIPLATAPYMDHIDPLLWKPEAAHGDSLAFYPSSFIKWATRCLPQRSSRSRMSSVSLR